VGRQPRRSASSCTITRRAGAGARVGSRRAVSTARRRRRAATWTGLRGGVELVGEDLEGRAQADAGRGRPAQVDEGVEGGGVEGGGRGGRGRWDRRVDRGAGRAGATGASRRRVATAAARSGRRGWCWPTTGGNRRRRRWRAARGPRRCGSRRGDRRRARLRAARKAASSARGGGRLRGRGGEERRGRARGGRGDRRRSGAALCSLKMRSSRGAIRRSCRRLVRSIKAAARSASSTRQLDLEEVDAVVGHGSAGRASRGR
jgi:hypothetical protein